MKSYISHNLLGYSRLQKKKKEWKQWCICQFSVILTKELVRLILVSYLYLFAILFRSEFSVAGRNIITGDFHFPLPPDHHLTIIYSILHSVGSIQILNCPITVHLMNLNENIGLAWVTFGHRFEKSRLVCFRWRHWLKMEPSYLCERCPENFRTKCDLSRAFRLPVY